VLIPYIVVLYNGPCCEHFPLQSIPLTTNHQFLYIIIRVSCGTSYGDVRIHETPTILAQYSSNNHVSRSQQNVSTRSASQSEFEIKLESIRPVEGMEGAFSGEDLGRPGGNLKV
jgi:hypothetical protein